ncbi:MAG: Mycolic acid cyclopropane synthetase, partial [Bacteroidota bacterium]
MENFKKFNQTDRADLGRLRVLNRNEIDTGHYDAMISLEVIEHVEQPQDFLDFLNAQLKPEGLLFLSDCFAGITSYWQTHLLSNERLSGMIPLMAAQSGFAFEGYNKTPLCKPYVFKKSDLTTEKHGNRQSLAVFYFKEKNKMFRSKLKTQLWH